ncbi:MAG: hypothetical protein HY760_04510 [Nitrospirae bacterium]|nr:hypothetical protein [Nitrospirota bacterium]
MALSSWYYVFLEESTPVRVYAFTALGVLLAGLGEFWMVRRVKNGKKG